MASSGKKPGIKDISDLKARLGLTKSKLDPAGKEQGASDEEGSASVAAESGSDAPAAEAAPAAPAAAAPAVAAPAPAAPAGIPAGLPAGAPPAAPAPMAAAPAGIPAGMPAPNPLAAAAPAPNPLGGFAPAQPPPGLSLAPPPVAAAPAAQPAPRPAPAASYDDDDDAYDYEAPEVSAAPGFDPNQVDPTLKAPRSTGKIALICGIVVLVAGASFFMGKTLESILQERTTVNRRIAVAGELIKKTKPKVEAFQEFIKPFKEKAESGGGMPGVAKYDKALFEHMKKFQNVDFMLDPSGDVPADSILLATSEYNPLVELRNYSSGSLMLYQLIGAHINATNADMTEIEQLVSADAGTLAMAIAFDADAYAELNETTGFDPKTQTFADEVPVKAKGLYPLRRPLLDPAEALPIWKTISEGVEGAGENPPHVIVELQRSSGEPYHVLSNEIIVIDRNQIFGGGTNNALTRYEQRMTQILKIVVDIEQQGGLLVEKLQKQADEEPL